MSNNKRQIRIIVGENETSDILSVVANDKYFNKEVTTSVIVQDDLQWNVTPEFDDNGYSSQSIQYFKQIFVHEGICRVFTSNERYSLESTDGVNFKKVPNPVLMTYLMYHNNVFIALDTETDKTYYSYDYETWHDGGTLNVIPLNTTYYKNNIIAFSSSFTGMSEDDGKTWNSIYNETLVGISVNIKKSIVYNDILYIQTSSATRPLMQTTDLTTWTDVDLYDINDNIITDDILFDGFAYNETDNSVAIVSETGRIFRSINGGKFMEIAAKNITTTFSVGLEYMNGRYMFYSEDNTSYISTDLINWEYAEAPFPSYQYWILHGVFNNRFIGFRYLGDDVGYTFPVKSTTFDVYPYDRFACINSNIKFNIKKNIFAFDDVLDVSISGNTSENTYFDIETETLFIAEDESPNSHDLNITFKHPRTLQEVKIIVRIVFEGELVFDTVPDMVGKGTPVTITASNPTLSYTGSRDFNTDLSKITYYIKNNTDSTTIIDKNTGLLTLGNEETSTSIEVCARIDSINLEISTQIPVQKSWIQLEVTGFVDPSAYKSITSNGTRLVSAGYNEPIAYSDDNGLTWTNTNITDRKIYKVKFLNNKFIACGAQTLMISDDGEAWTEITTIDTTGTYMDVDFGDGRYVLIGNAGISYYSFNATSWSLMSGLPSSNAQSVKFNNGIFVALYANDLTYYSTNGTSWTQLDTAKIAKTAVIATYDNKFIVMDNDTSRSTDGTSAWSIVRTFDDTSYNNAAYSSENQLILIQYSAKKMHITTDFTSWETLAYVPFGSDVCIHDGKYYLITSTALIYTYDI